MKRAFINDFPNKLGKELRVIDTELNEYEHYLQNKEFGFIFSYSTGSIESIGYKTVDQYIKTLKERNLLGEEIDYNQQRESERIGRINLETEQQRIKANKEEYSKRLVLLKV